jgi:hypothetical protein
MNFNQVRYQALVEALWNVDPLGIADDRRHAAAEYDSLADRAYEHLYVFRSVNAAVGSIVALLESDWGFSPSSTMRLKLYDQLKALVPE